mmetsp:Transcript_119712/g.298575  ORF Transcript_119712/g.298575 Transcript_119712/m.298575 type:complete len:233 (+) Transcript_119712:412-1110(+)
MMQVVHSQVIGPIAGVVAIGPDGEDESVCQRRQRVSPAEVGPPQDRGEVVENVLHGMRVRGDQCHGRRPRVVELVHQSIQLLVLVEEPMPVVEPDLGHQQAEGCLSCQDRRAGEVQRDVEKHCLLCRQERVGDAEGDAQHSVEENQRHTSHELLERGYAVDLDLPDLDPNQSRHCHRHADQLRYEDDSKVDQAHCSLGTKTPDCRSMQRSCRNHPIVHNLDRHHGSDDLSGE